MAIVKKIRDNSGSGKEFEDVTTSEVTYDTTPQLGSFNAVTSDGVAKALEVATEIPVVSAETNGKVLTASWDAETSTGSTEWGDAGSGVPEYSTTEDGKVLGVVDNFGTAELQWVEPTKVKYANQELTVRPPDGAPSLIVDTSNATPVTDTEPYSGDVMDYSSSELIVVFSGALGTMDLASCTLSIVSNIDATGITLGDLEFNYYRIDHGDDSYTEEPISPMVVTGATSASPSKILAGDYVVPIVPNPDPSYPDLCVKVTYSGSPDQADLDAFVNQLSSSVWPWSVGGDVRVAAGYSLKPAVLPDITGQAGKVLGVVDNFGTAELQWVNAGGTTYVSGSSATVNVSEDSVTTNSVDVTGIVVGADVKSAIVQWTVASTTTLPTVTDGTNPLKASVNNPASLTVGRTVQVSILNGTWVCAEFA